MKSDVVSSKAKIYILIAIVFQIIIMIALIFFYDIIAVSIDPIRRVTIEELEWSMKLYALHPDISLKTDKITFIFQIIKFSMLILNTSFWTMFRRGAFCVIRKYWWILVLCFVTFLAYIYIANHWIQYYRVYMILISEEIFTVMLFSLAVLILRTPSQNMANSNI